MIKNLVKLYLIICFIPHITRSQELTRKEAEAINNDSTSTSFSPIPKVTGNAYIFNYAVLNNIPLRNVEEVIPHLPGMVEQDGKLHMRGSRFDEIGYELEGASVRDVMTGENLELLIPEALDELKLQALPIDARDGNAAGGLVQYKMRSGLNRLQSSLIMESDEFTSQNKSLFNTYSYGYRNLVGTLSGLLPGLRSHGAFFIAGQYTGYKDSHRVFWEGFEFDNLLNTGVLPGDTLDLLTVLPGNIPHSSFNKWTGNASLDLNFGPVKLRGITALTFQRSRDNQLPIQHLFNGVRIPVEEKSSGLFSLKACINYRTN